MSDENEDMVRLHLPTATEKIKSTRRHGSRAKGIANFDAMKSAINEQIFPSLDSALAEHPAIQFQKIESEFSAKIETYIEQGISPGKIVGLFKKHCPEISSKRVSALCSRLRRNIKERSTLPKAPGI